MIEHDCSRVQLKSSYHNLSGMYRASIIGASEQFLNISCLTIVLINLALIWLVWP